MSRKENISRHISYAEGTTTLIQEDNTPNEKQLVKMRFVAENLFEPTRKLLGNHKIGINSFFRSKTVNKLAKGSRFSQHKKGEAIDMTAGKSPFISNIDIFNTIQDNLQFDQLIIYICNTPRPDGGLNVRFVHASLKEKKNRNQIIVATKDNYFSKYSYLKLKKSQKLNFSEDKTRWFIEKLA